VAVGPEVESFMRQANPGFSLKACRCKPTLNPTRAQQRTNLTWITIGLKTRSPSRSSSQRNRRPLAFPSRKGLFESTSFQNATGPPPIDSSVSSARSSRCSFGAQPVANRRRDGLGSDGRVGPPKRRLWSRLRRGGGGGGWSFERRRLLREADRGETTGLGTFLFRFYVPANEVRCSADWSSSFTTFSAFQLNTFARAGRASYHPDWLAGAFAARTDACRAND